jgi:ornithine carbamoyltransferase
MEQKARANVIHKRVFISFGEPHLQCPKKKQQQEVNFQCDEIKMQVRERWNKFASAFCIIKR